MTGNGGALALSVSKSMLWVKGSGPNYTLTTVAQHCNRTIWPVMCFMYKARSCRAQACIKDSRSGSDQSILEVLCSLEDIAQ